MAAMAVFESGYKEDLTVRSSLPYARGGFFGTDDPGARAARGSDCASVAGHPIGYL